MESVVGLWLFQYSEEEHLWEGDTMCCQEKVFHLVTPKVIIANCGPKNPLEGLERKCMLSREAKEAQALAREW